MLLPVTTVLGHPPGRLLDRTDERPAAAEPALPLARQQPGTLEHAEVPRDGGQGDVEGRGQLTHRRLAARQRAQDRAPDGIGERGEDGVEAGGRMLNHVVKHLRGPACRVKTVVTRGAPE